VEQQTSRRRSRQLVVLPVELLTSRTGFTFSEMKKKNAMLEGVWRFLNCLNLKKGVTYCLIINCEKHECYVTVWFGTAMQFEKERYSVWGVLKT
jgi:hypothetical protein